MKKYSKASTADRAALLKTSMVSEDVANATDPQNNDCLNTAKLFICMSFISDGESEIPINDDVSTKLLIDCRDEVHAEQPTSHNLLTASNAVLDG